MGVSSCKCVHLGSSNLPCGPVSLQAKLHGGVTLRRSCARNFKGIVQKYYTNFLPSAVSQELQYIGKGTLCTTNYP